jgi:hypothetical protein
MLRPIIDPSSRVDHLLAREERRGRCFEHHPGRGGIDGKQGAEQSWNMPPESREEKKVIGVEGRLFRSSKEDPRYGSLIMVCSIGLVEDILKHAAYREAGLLSVSCKSIGDSVSLKKRQGPHFPPPNFDQGVNCTKSWLLVLIAIMIIQPTFQSVNCTKSWLLVLIAIMIIQPTLLFRPLPTVRIIKSSARHHG